MSSKTYVRITAVPLSLRMKPIKLKSAASTERHRRILYDNCFITQSAADEPMEKRIRELLCITDMSRVENDFIENLRDPQVAVIFKLEEIRKTKRKSGFINKRIRRVSICPYALTYTMTSHYDRHEYIRELTDVTLLRHLVRPKFSGRFELIRMPNLDLCDTVYLFETKSMLYPEKGFKTRVDNQFQVKTLTIGASDNLVSQVIHEPFQTLDIWFPCIGYMPDQDILSLFGKIYQITETHKKCLIQARLCHSESDFEQFRIIYALCTDFISPLCVKIGNSFICFLIQGIDEDDDFKAYPIHDSVFIDPFKTIKLRRKNRVYVLSPNQGCISIAH